MGPAISVGIAAGGAKKGRKAAVGARVGGRSIGESIVGAAPGGIIAGYGARTALVGAARNHSRMNMRGNKLALAGGGLAALGGLAGQYHGAYRATRNAQKRGDMM